MSHQSGTIRWARAVRRRISIDTRGLAVFRMALGVLLLVDLSSRATDLVAFYTDGGVVPRTALSSLAPTFRAISIHAQWGSATAQAGLFVIAGVVAVLLLVGYRTTVATVVSFLLLVSLHARNPAVLNGGDILLRHLLLWGCLLPLGEQWSVDAVEESRDSVAGFATAGLLVQVVVVYLTNAIFKFRGERWLRGEAVEQVLALTRFATPLGQALLDVPYLLTLADYGWLALLVASPLLVVVTGPRRAILPVLLGAMHLGMALFMELGLFPFVSIAALIPFLPPAVWDRVPDPPSIQRLATRPPTPGTPPAVRRGLNTLVEPVAAVLLCGMILLNGASVGYLALPDGTPATLEDRAWDMFAPHPPSQDGWYVLPARLESNRRVDALRGGPPRWDRPPDVDYPNSRWRKLLSQIRQGRQTVLQRPLATYLCHRWNRSHDDGMVRLRIVYIPYSIQEDRRGDPVELGAFEC